MTEAQNDLVRRIDLISYVCDWFDNCVGCPFLGCGGTSKVCQFKLVVNEVPSVDAVPVVRCRDCIYSKPNDGKLCDGARYCTITFAEYSHKLMAVWDTDYCSKGTLEEVQSDI